MAGMLAMLRTICPPSTAEASAGWTNHILASRRFCRGRRPNNSISLPDLRHGHNSLNSITLIAVSLEICSALAVAESPLMADTIPRGNSPPPPAEARPERRRRKIRKGTASCWECKRRKARCTFANPADASCVGCRRRGTACVSQEFADQPQPNDTWRTQSRLRRLEVLVEQLTDRLDVVPGMNGISQDLSTTPSTRRDIHKEPRPNRPCRTCGGRSPRTMGPDPDPSTVEGLDWISWLHEEIVSYCLPSPFLHTGSNAV